jgi:outer membrane protein assembly factor BamB
VTHRLAPVAILLLAGLVFVPQPAKAAGPSDVAVQWVQCFFDQAHDGHNPYETILSPSTVGGLKVMWSAVANLGQMVNPLVTTSTVYVAGAQSGVNTVSWLLAYDRATGALLWEVSQPTGDTPDGIATLSGRVFLSTISDHTIRAYDGASGDLLWTHPTGGAALSPTVAYGTVFLQTNFFELDALDPATGDPKWSVGYGGSGGGSSSPAVAGTRLFTADGDGNAVEAFRTTTGAWLWTTPVDARDGGSPTAADGMVFVGTSGISAHSLYALDQRSGAVVWKVATAEGVESTPAVANGTVYVGDDGGNLYAFRESDGTQLWRAHTQYGFGLSAPIVANGVVYAVTLGAYAFDAVTGKRLWRHATDDIVNFAPALVDGVLYVPDFSGTLWAFGLPSDVG